MQRAPDMPGSSPSTEEDSFARSIATLSAEESEPPPPTAPVMSPIPPAAAPPPVTPIPPAAAYRAKLVALSSPPEEKVAFVDKLLTKYAGREVQLAHMLEGKQLSLEASEKFAQAVISQVTCPISLRLCVRPVVAADGRVYERDAIERWLSSKSTSPLTNQEMGDRLVDCASTRSLILEAIEDGVIENDAAAAWHVESAKAKAAGKLPGDLSSVNEHLIRATVLSPWPNSSSNAKEITLMNEALALRLRVDTLKKAAADAGTDGVATILQLPNYARMMELHRENAGLRQTIRFLERGRGQRRGTSDSAGTPPRMTMTRAEVEEYYLGPGGLESVVSPSARGLTAAAAPEARIVVDVEFPPEFGARGAAM